MLKPISGEEFINFRNICLKNDNFTEYSKEGNTICYQGINIKPGYFCTKAITTDLFIKYSVQQIFDFLNDENFRNQWDALLMSREIIKQIDDCNQIIHYCTTLPMISKRDYVYYKSIWMSDDKEEFIILNKSVDIPECPEVNGFVRALCEMSGYMVKKNEKGENVFYYYAYNAFGGWVPTWVVNSLISSQGYSLLKKLSECCEKYPEWKKTHNPEEKPWNVLKDKVIIPK
ncbi:START domain containing protein, putative [Entamoeba histolytica]